MISEHIDKIKLQYTDKYVVVDGERPELARFAELVGQVKTVNMSGRALVEFMDYHLSTGWYDIDLDFLKVVDKPKPKEKGAEAKKPAAKAAPAVASKPAAAKPASGGKMSTADILAMARGGQKSEAPAAPAEPVAKEEPAAAPVEAAPKGADATVDRSAMSVEEMIAWCREHDAS